jgi:hypothetical protein
MKAQSSKNGFLVSLCHTTAALPLATVSVLPDARVLGLLLLSVLLIGPMSGNGAT